MEFDPAVVISAAAAIATTIVMVVSLRYQVRKDAAEQQKAMRQEIRHLVSESEGRHRESLADVRQSIRTIHERIDRKENDYKQADREVAADVKAMVAGVGSLQGEVKAIRTQMTIIQQGLQERAKS